MEENVFVAVEEKVLEKVKEKYEDKIMLKRDYIYINHSGEKGGCHEAFITASSTVLASTRCHAATMHMVKP